MISDRGCKAYSPVFQGIAEPVGIVPSVSDHPISGRQAARQCPSARVVTYLTGGHEETDGATGGIGDSVQLRVHGPLGSPNQTSFANVARTSGATWLIPLFQLQARRRAMGFQISRVNHDRLMIGMLGS